MIDWSEGQLKLVELTKQLYEQMLTGNFTKAIETCDLIVVEARLTKAKVTMQEKNT
jgi:hypothetical protein